jgi:tetratricopeptide (TPR) repeat protein
MALADPYGPCPCGSGEKFKWCCHKAEAYAEKALRLVDSGQLDAALSALDDGLRKVPGSPWLLLRKGLILLEKDRPAEARATFESLLASKPGHPAAHALLVRLVLQKEGPGAGVAQLQKALTDVPPDRRPGLARIIQLVGAVLGELGHIPAALRHLELARSLGPRESDRRVELDQLIHMLEGNPGISPWLRDPARLVPPPEGIPRDAADRFRQALAWAEDGLWSSAAAMFQTLASDDLIEAERNLAFCRLWLDDDSAAVASLRRVVARLGETPEAVDLEALRQLVKAPADDDFVDHVHLIWNIRDREALLTALRASDQTQFNGTGPLDPEDPNSFEVDEFELLDRPKPTGPLPEDVRELPRVLGRILVAREIVMLDAVDDGRLDDVTTRFTDLAGSAIPPAQPRTKEVGKILRYAAAMRSEWWLPDDAPRELGSRLQSQEREHLLTEVWPRTPLPALGGRTPQKAAAAGDAGVALRAAVCQLELSQPVGASAVDLTPLRRSLGIADEPELDPATVDIPSVHLARLHRIPAERLDDDRLVALYSRARRFVMPGALEQAARALIERPALLERPEVGHVPVYSDLAMLSVGRPEPDDPASWLRRGRQADPASKSTTALRWDLAEIRHASNSEPPEAWVPQLAVVLDRYRGDKEANPRILSMLVDLGLIQAVPHPEDPNELMFDTRPLQAVLAEYGPRITTATGDLGISAARGGIWTPGSEGGATTPGGIWTPGSGSGEPGGEKKLILPG